MNTIKVRAFLDGDGKSIAHIHNMAFKEWIESLGKEYDYRYITPKDVLAWIKENHSKHESLWIAEMDGEAVGYTHCHLEEIRGKKVFKELLFVHTSRDMGQSKIAVIPKYRCRGVAKALIQKCLEYFKHLGANLAVVVTYSDNKIAKKLLQQMGFVHQELFYYKPYSDKKPWRYDTIYAELYLNNPIKPPLKLNQDICLLYTSPSPRD